MTDLIVRNIEPSLVERVKRFADARGWSLQDALVSLLDRGLAWNDYIDGALDGDHARVLKDAIIALENVPSDPGFGLIGRAEPTSPPMHDASDQSSAAGETLPT